MPAPVASRPDAPRPRRRLFWKYVVVIVALVTTLLVASGGVELWFSYQESRDALVALQREKAAAAAGRIEAFIREIERQMGWTTMPLLAAGSAALEQRRIDFIRLQRQVRPITDLQYLDPEGKEQLRVSRLAMEVVGSGTDFSADPRFTQALARKAAQLKARKDDRDAAFHGPVYFRKESEPYMVVAMAQSGGGVTVAEVNLKFIWDVVTEIKIGKAGRAYVIDEGGNLIAHPDISLVLQKTSLSALPHVREALAASGRATPTAVDVQGRRVLTAHATIPELRWTVFAEQPLEEALAPLEASLKRSLVLIAIGVSLAIGASLVLARRMVRPIQALQVGAARIGGGELGHRIEVRTGDELQALAAEFNRMTATLQESYATLEQRVVERTQELTESLEQQTATSEILRVISSSPTDARPVFQTILANAARLCEASVASLFLMDGDELTSVANQNASGEFAEYLAHARLRPSRETSTRRSALERRTIHVDDLLSDPEYSPSVFQRRENVRTVLSVPMLREGVLVGVITLWRREVRPFAAQQIALVETFADQAVIAIENVRLFTELQSKNAALTESLEQQTATSEILRVISGSPTDIQPVLDAVAESSARLCEASDGVIHLRELDDHLRIAAHFGSIPAGVGVRRPIGRGWVAGRSVLDGQPIHVHDLQADEAEDPLGSEIARSAGHRTILAMPLLREGEAIGVIQVRRTEARPFSEKHVTLLRTFAAQAVIAMENVRLFTALESRNADLTDALEQQTATGEILRVISSSPTDTQPVFDTIIRNAVRLSGAVYGLVTRVEAGFVDFVAHHNIDADEFGRLRRLWPQPVHSGGPTSQVVSSGTVLRLSDLQADAGGLSNDALARMRARGVRSMVVVPMFRHGQVIGTINLTHQAVGAFSDAHVALIRTFADQAVIAIENVRLFKELESKNAALSETLEQQTATSEILRVISSSPTDLRPVFEAILDKATDLCDASLGALGRYDGERYEHLAHRGASPEFQQYLFGGPRVLGETTGIGRMISARRPVHIADIRDEEAYRSGDPARLATADIAGARTFLAVPMLKEGRVVGGIVIYRREVRPFDEKQIDLVTTFASQAVIAIENVRLFTELESRNAALSESLDQQTATAEILRVISGSPTDIQPVLEIVAQNAARVCGASDALIRRVEGNVMTQAAHFGEVPLNPAETRAITRDSVSGRAILERRTIHLHNLLDPEFAREYPEGAALQQQAGYRTIVATPLLREGSAVGVMMIRRMNPDPFTDKQIALLETFADQAVIAIENVRLFTELQQRNAEVTEALEQQTATGEILGVISQSPTDVQPVFNTIVSSAARLCEAPFASVYRLEDGVVSLAAISGGSREQVEALKTIFPRPADNSHIVGRVLQTRQLIHVEDIGVDRRMPDLQRVIGYRTLLAVPMLREGAPIGAIGMWRTEARPFSEAQIKLLQTFADQAVIAIENVRLFTELQDRTAQLQVANRHKDEFLANMSHELRTPLNAIIGFSEVMLERMFGDLTDKQDEYLNDILSSGRHLLSLINDILDLSKIEAGRMELELTDFNLPVAIDNALTLVHERAARRGLTLTQDVDERLGDFRGDERKIKQVLLNLLSNAIKFTPEGGRVEVRAHLKGAVAEVAVADTGVGIAPEDQELIFEEFRQVGTDVAKKHEGTGLGLALARRFVELHGGNLWLESEVGVGSTFTFELPARHEHGG